MGFRTKLDYSDNRQLKQRERTSTTLSGTTVFGMPFSALTSGPDLNTTGTTDTYVSILSSFSGNSTTTIFTWYDSRMALAASTLSAITSSTSGITQETTVLTASTSTIIDGNTVNLTYTGVSFDITVNYIILSGGNYTGTVQHTFLDFYSANTLDFTGRTIWVDNTEITRTDRLIVSRGAQTGYILTAVNSEGMVGWVPASGFSFSGGSGNCITDLYVTNVFGCSPITIHDDTIISGSTSKKLGINTSPSYTLDILSQDGTSNLVYDDTTDSQNLTLSGKTNGLYYVDVRATDVGILRLGVVGKSYTGATTFGVTGDSYVYSSVLSNGLNIISAPGTGTDDYIRFYAGKTATSQPDLHIQGSGSTIGYIGIGTTDPQDTLHIKSSASALTLEGSDHVYMNFYPDGYSAGRKGWFGFGNSADDNITLTNQTVTGGTLFKTNDTARMFISSSGNSGNVGIGTISPTEKLEVNGRTKTTTLQITSGATNNHVLVSDSNGVGRWSSRIFTTGSTNNNAIYDVIGSHTMTSVSDYSIIAGGYLNIISDTTYSGIFAGQNNSISGLTVTSGSSTNTTIIGGQNNLIYNNIPTGGLGSLIGIGSSDNSSIIGGKNNSIYGHKHSIILGGTGNTIHFDFPSVYNNSESILGSLKCGITSSTVSNITASSGSTINGSNQSLIIGGVDNSIASVDNSVIIGGSGNTLGLAGSVGGNIVVIGCTNVIAQTDNMVYVPDLIIDGLISVTDLRTNASGQLIDGASDIRLKENINQLQNSLSILKNLRGVSFEYTQESNMGNGLRYGFIAQEVQEFIPDIVRSRVKGNGMLSLSYTEIIPLLVEAIKEITYEQTTSNNTYLETQTIVAEDNNIELNFNGTHESALDGGIIVKNGVNDNVDAYFKINSNGDWITNSNIIANGIVIPEYTPTSSSDINGIIGNITRDDNYLYLKGTNGWKRTKLESF